MSVNVQMWDQNCSLTPRYTSLHSWNWCKFVHLGIIAHQSAQKLVLHHQIIWLALGIFPLHFWWIRIASPSLQAILQPTSSNADGTSCSGWPFRFLSIIFRASETCLPTTNINALPFPPAPLAVLPTRRTYSLGSRGKSKSMTWSTPAKSIPRDALSKIECKLLLPFHNLLKQQNK